MLVLSRRCQESVVIGGTSRVDRKLVVTVLEITGTNVRLGFEAPIDMPVHRLELWKRIYAEVNPDEPMIDPRVASPK
jgi:carbon storage regulator